jgi:hypothetical protein
VNFTPEDVHRSVRRWLSMVLEGPPWRVLTERRVIADDARPQAVVEPSSPLVTTFARAAIPQGEVAKMRSFAVQAYPTIGASAQESRLEATRVEGVLDDAVTHGLVNPLPDDVFEDIGGPFRIPVWDYAGVPVKGSGRAGPAQPYGMLRVQDHSFQSIQDTLDEVRFTVTGTLRLTWDAAGRVAANAEPWVSDVIGRWQSAP